MSILAQALTPNRTNASKSKSKMRSVTPLGPTLVDVQVIVPSQTGLIKCLYIEQPFVRQTFLPTRKVYFGFRKYPVPNKAEVLTAAMYGDDWATKRKFKSLSSSKSIEVPKNGVPFLAYPSEQLPM